MKRINRISRVRVAALATVALAFAPAIASETVTYKYDARGRLRETSHGGTVNNGVLSCYLYDRADNRTQVDVKTSGACPLPPPSFSVSDVSVTEGSNVVFTVTRLGSTTSSVGVSYATANGTAIAGAQQDYTTKSGSLAFLSGQTSKTVSVVTNNDSTFEPAETFYLNLSSPTGGATIADDQALGTINDNEGFRISDDTDQESRQLSFIITKDGTASNNITVAYATTDGTATAGSDYSPVSGAVTFSPTESTKTVYVNTTLDNAPEQNETFFVNLTSASMGAILDGSGKGTINDDDSPPTFSVLDGSGPEGGWVRFTINKSGLTAGSYSVNISTANGTATTPSDYYAITNHTLTFAPSEASKTWDIQIFQDSAIEGNETLKLNLSGATGGAQISDSLAIGTIVDDDTSGTGGNISISDATCVEGEVLHFTVTRTSSTGTASVQWATAPGTASGDFTAASGTVTFSAGQTSKTIDVQTRGDLKTEPIENMFVNLSSPVNASISDQQGEGRIYDNGEGGCVDCLQGTDPDAEGSAGATESTEPPPQ